MDERSAIAVLSGERQDAVARMLRSVCRPASWVYSAAVRLRNLGYDRGWFRSERVDVPVISVGNITTGGTGKTPVVGWLVQELSDRGYRPGILSRGYRSLDGVANDEALVLERLCPGTPHVQQRDRVAGARRAIAEFGCDVLVLDDGFQHRRLQRDLDILLIDAAQPWGYGHLLPRGLLREPMSHLWRADLVCVTRAETDRLSDLPEILMPLKQHRGTDAVSLMSFEPTRWLCVDGRSLPLSQFQNARLAAFCGIGNPAAFWKTVQGCGNLVAQRSFADHHHYTSAELLELDTWRQAVGADWLVTTLKDLVKIPADHPLAWRVAALDIGCVWRSNFESLRTALHALCPPRRTIRHAA